jgi:homopolymeric O-antigen transport system ATP-binding protein
MSDAVIKVEKLGKQYQIGASREPYKSLRDALAGLARVPRGLFGRNGHEPAGKDRFWPLRDVSFEIKQGEVVGVIGRNGAGKSTLLKILSRITTPTEGRVSIRGRVGALLEVGTGFHPELSGRENIMLNGAILGMRKSEIERNFDAIVAFAEVEKFIDTPVKRYSSGMYLRLAFAVAAHLEPEILLVDEVLAVGDAEFQKKCLGKMGEVAKQGRTVLFVSHNMGAVQNLCGRGLLLHQGKLFMDTDADEAVRSYLSLIPAQGAVLLRERTDREGNGRLRFTGFSICAGSRGQVDTIQTGDDVTFVIDYECERPLANVSVSLGFYNQLGQHIFMCNTKLTGQDFKTVPSRGNFTVNVRKFPLVPGRYMLNLHSEANGLIADWVRDVTAVDVIEGDFFGTGKLPPASHPGVVVEHDWKCHGE